MNTRIFVALAMMGVVAGVAFAQPVTRPVSPLAPVAPSPDATPAQPGTGTTSPPPGSAAPAAPPSPPAKPAPPADPHLLRFYLVDGTVLIGKPAAKVLDIETRFGKLAVPLEKIRWIRPGYEQQAQRKASVAGWLDDLGSDDPAKRKAAAAELAKLGPGLRPQLLPMLQDASTIRVGEVKALIEKINEATPEGDQGPFERSAISALDAIVTTEFAMLGRVTHASLSVANEYGTFELPIGQVKMIDRGGAVEQRAGSFTVNEQHLTGRTFAATKIQIDKGDQIVLRATGQIQIPRYGTGAVSGPDGAANYGWYLNGKIPNGALLLRIGNGETHKAGTSLKIVAKESGELHLGIGMNSRFVREGQAFPGEYKVEVTVTRE